MKSATLAIPSVYHDAEVAQLIERRLAKAKVAGLIPVFRSNFKSSN
jgi:hypothetical protein